MATRSIRFEYYETPDGLDIGRTEWRWRLVAANGENVANGSEGYSRKSGVLRAIARVEEMLAFSFTGEQVIPVIQVQR